jgi:hypothetical protein
MNLRRLAMSDIKDGISDELKSGKAANRKWEKVHALKLGPYAMAVGIEMRAYSNHTGGPSSTAWTRLYYDRDLVGDASREGTTLDPYIDYYVILGANNEASFRIDLGNRNATVKNFGFSFVVTPV